MCQDNASNLDSVESFLETDPGFLVPYAETSIVMMKQNLGFFSVFIKNIGTKLSDVKQETIIAYQKHLNDKGLSSNSYAQRMSHLRTLMKYIGKRFRYRSVKLTRYANMNIIDLENYRKLTRYLELKMVDKSHRKYPKYLRDFIMLNIFYITGLRKMEVLKLKHCDIFEENNIILYRVKIKGGKDIAKEFLKSIYVLIQELKAVEKKESHDYIFTDNSGHAEQSKNRLQHHVPNQILKKYCDHVIGKTRHFTIHGIRNLSGYSVQKHSNDIYTTKNHLNHSKIATTVEYLQQISIKTQAPIELLKRDLESF